MELIDKPTESTHAERDPVCMRGLPVAYVSCSLNANCNLVPASREARQITVRSAVDAGSACTF